MTMFNDPNFPSLFTERPEQIRNFDRELISSLAMFSQTLRLILDSGIDIDDNLDVSRVSVVSHATPGTEFSVSHGLGKIPKGYIVYGQSKAGSVYDGGTTNTKTLLYLKSDASSCTFNILFF